MHALVSSLIGTTVLVAALATSTAAQASYTPQLACDDGTTYSVASQPKGNAFQLSGSTLVYVVHSASSVGPSGELVPLGKVPQSRADLVSCDYTSPSGRQYVFDGFFTTERA